MAVAAKKPRAAGTRQFKIIEAETKKARLLLAIPCAELAYARFWQLLLTVQGLGKIIDRGDVVTVSNAYVHAAHNTLVDAALQHEGFEGPWDYLFFLEHDHSFPPNLFEIAESWTEPIVGGLYFNRVPEDPQPVAYRWDASRQSIKRLQPFEVHPMLEEPGLYEVDVIGLGCTAVRRDVFETWPKDLAIFGVPTNPSSLKTMSDDVWFCRHAQDLGWRIWCDSRVQPTHFGLVPFDARFYIGWVQHMRDNKKTRNAELADFDETEA